MARTLTQRVVQENRDFDTPEIAQWEALNDELDSLDRKLGAIQGPRARLAPELANPDYPWKAKVNYARKDPPPKLPAGCWHLAIPW